jgi:hypothetical protein
MKNSNIHYFKTKQAVLPLFISDYLDICDPVLVFDRFMEEIDLEKYLRNVPAHVTGRIRYNPTSMLKTILFGFMTNGYISLRFMYLMDHETPSYRTFGYFIENMIKPSVEELFSDINKKIFAKDHVDLSHLYIDGSKFEANANNTAGYGRKQLKSPDIDFLKKSRGYSMKSTSILPALASKLIRIPNTFLSA